MNAQTLYDLRDLTGFVSGNDLNELFVAVVGDPSPHGDVEVHEDDLASAPYGEDAIEILSFHPWWINEMVRNYTGVDFLAAREGSRKEDVALSDVNVSAFLYVTREFVEFYHTVAVMLEKENIQWTKYVTDKELQRIIYGAFRSNESIEYTFRSLDVMLKEK